MRQLLSFGIVCLLLACTQEIKTPEKKVESNLEFLKYFESLKQIDPKERINPLKGQRSSFDSLGFKKYGLHNADWPWGKIGEIDGNFVTVECLFGDFTYPFVMCYDSLGKKTDSLKIWENTFYSESDNGRSIFYYSEAGQFIILDTIHHVEMDSNFNEIPGGETWKYINRVWWLEEDKFVLHKNDTSLISSKNKDFGNYNIVSQVSPPEPWHFNVKLYYKGKVVFQDNQNEFDFEDRLWNTFNQLSDSSLLILLEVNERPEANRLKALTVRNDKIIKEEQLPSFENQPKDIDNDGKLEYFGALQNIETSYVPYYAYEYSDSIGYVMDSIASIKYNKAVWDTFAGWQPNFNLEVKFKSQ